MANNGLMAIPALTISAANSGLNYSLPVITFSGTGLTGEVGSLDKSLFALSLTAQSNDWGNCSVELPSLEAELTAGGIALFEMSIIDVSATGLTGRISDLNCSLPKLTLTAVGYDEELGTLASTLAALSMDASGHIVPVGTCSVTFPSLQLIIEATSSGRFNSYVLKYIRP